MRPQRRLLAALSALLLVPPAAAQPRAVPARGVQFQPAGLKLPAVHPSYLQAAPLAPALPVVGPEDFGELTGAVTRRRADPGAVKRMWLVYGSAEERLEVADVLERLKAANPGVEVVEYDASVVPMTKPAKDEEPKVDRKALAERISAEKADFVLSTNQDLYEKFRGLRDSEYHRDTPFGIAGRRHVSVDIPRSTLDPARLSDVRALPHRTFAEVTASAPSTEGIEAAGMRGKRQAFEALLTQAESAAHGAAKKDEDMGFVERKGMGLLMKLSGQADDKATKELRAQAHKLAGWIAREKVDVLATDDPKAAAALGMMKRMGYHKSLAVVWESPADPGDASAVNLALYKGAWLERAPWVKAVRARKGGQGASLAEGLKQARRLERLPDNFMDMGGVSVAGFEPAVGRVIEQAAPPAPKGRYDLHFLLTNGNGVKSKGDANPFGHFGMAVTDEEGRVLVWTVQYNDGGSFTGGLGAGKQLTLAEYLYTLWYLPGATGQAIPLAETAVADVVDFVWKGAVDEAGLEAGRRVAAAINALHLQGKDNYSFLNKGGMTNCISLVTQILRAMGFPIAESGIQAPADKAVEMIAGMARLVLGNRISHDQMGLVVFERPAHAGPEHYRIKNTALGTPLFTRRKDWDDMALWEKAWRLAQGVPNLVRSLRIPGRLEDFAAQATDRVTVAPASRELVVTRNADSPILKLREAAAAAARLRKERVPIDEQLTRINAELFALGGMKDYRPSADGAPDASEVKKEALLRRQRELAVRLGLNNIDEQIAQNAIVYHRLRLAEGARRWRLRDLFGFHVRGRLEKVRALHERVLEVRRRIEVQDRVLEPSEVQVLKQLNDEAWRHLRKVQVRLLQDAGPGVPVDIAMIMRQITPDALAELIGEKSPGKGKSGKK